MGFPEVPQLFSFADKKVAAKSGDPSRMDRTSAPLAVASTGLVVRQKSAERPSHEVSRRLEAAREVIETEYFQEINCQTLAGVAQMSLHHFIRAFRDRYGASPYRYLTKVRINAAKRLLQKTCEPIEVIAAGTGFQSGPSLNRAFRQLEGISISRYCHVMRMGQVAPLELQIRGKSGESGVLGSISGQKYA